jgi:hypothetical protein
VEQKLKVNLKSNKIKSNFFFKNYYYEKKFFNHKDYPNNIVCFNKKEKKNVLHKIHVVMLPVRLIFDHLPQKKTLIVLQDSPNFFKAEHTSKTYNMQIIYVFQGFDVLHKTT